MKAFWKWIINNLSNIFGLLGIILTLYFGIFYVPAWLRESQNEKIANAEKNLQQSIKELIYSDSICNYVEVATLIEAKELLLNQKYPFSPQEVLTKVQESFMQDRFLPLEKRKQLIAELESLKNDIPKTPAIEEEKAESKNSVWIYEWISILISLIAVITGIVSFFIKYRTEKEKDQEIKNQIIESENQKSNIEYAIDFEKQIIDVIKNYSGVKILRTSEDRDFGFDLEFEFNDQRFFVEAKYLTRSKVGLNSFERFLSNQKGLEGEFWFIYNTDITEMVRRRADEMNKISHPNRTISLILAENGEALKRKLYHLLPTTRGHK